VSAYSVMFPPPAHLVKDLMAMEEFVAWAATLIGRDDAARLADSCRATAIARSRESIWLHLPSDYTDSARRALQLGWVGVVFEDAEAFLIGSKP